MACYASISSLSIVTGRWGAVNDGNASASPTSGGFWNQASSYESWGHQFERNGRDNESLDGATSQDQFVPGSEGHPAVRVRVYRPSHQPSKLPALYWIHGGGYVMGDIEQDDRLMKQLVKRIGCVAVSVDYRLAPEHPFPAPVEDCYAGLKWLFAHADELGVEPARIAIGGASGGGGLAAGLALLARDRGEVQVAFHFSSTP